MSSKSNIPIFPIFKSLEITDKSIIEEITGNHPPYSDYNFASLWSYNVSDDIVISRLNTNLVVRFRDYITNNPFYSFIGEIEVPDTVRTLLDYSQKQGLESVLKLVPEVNILAISNTAHQFTIQEDPDNFDYIYSTLELTELKGSKFGKKRNFIHKFTKEYADASVSVLDLNNQAVHNDLIRLFHTWNTNKDRDPSESAHELTALKRLLSHASHFNLHVLGIHHSGSLIAFTIVEISQNGYGVFHFTKANTDYQGVYSMVYHTVAKQLHEKGVIHLNREQDLGISGLKKAKSEWNPTHQLKKYVITPQIT